MSSYAAPVVDVTKFDLTSLLRCGRAVREAAKDATSLEESTQAITRVLYDACIDPETGQRSCALVRFYKTHDYANLGPRLQAFARRMLSDQEPRPDMKTLVLVATVGEQPAWSDRRRSRGHQAIPLASVEMVQQAPMIAGLFEQFGLAPRDVIQPPSEVLPDRGGKTYNVFHVPEAQGSDLIPAQADFVQRYGIRSVVGFGGELRSGNLFATILFSHRPIPRESANRFRALAMDVKTALFFVDEVKTFPD